MDIALKRKDGFIYFTAKSDKEITREEGIYIQEKYTSEKYGTKSNDNGFYAFVKRKIDKHLFQADWCCRDENNKLSDVRATSALP